MHPHRRRSSFVSIPLYKAGLVPLYPLHGNLLEFLGVPLKTSRDTARRDGCVSSRRDAQWRWLWRLVRLRFRGGLGHLGFGFLLSGFGGYGLGSEVRASEICIFGRWRTGGYVFEFLGLSLNL